MRENQGRESSNTVLRFTALRSFTLCDTLLCRLLIQLFPADRPGMRIGISQPLHFSLERR